MGADIHINLEYRDKNGHMEPVISNLFNAGRDYRLFSALAGVRGYNDPPPKYKPRGIPHDCCQEIFDQFYSEVIPDNASEFDKRLAQNWIFESTLRHYLDLKINVNVVNKYEVKYASSPDWHTSSYLNKIEVLEALEFRGLKIEDAPIEFQLVLDFMTSIDQKFGDCAARIVFWFDN